MQLFNCFCDKNLLLNWHCPDHANIEEFSSQIILETQRKLAHLIAINAAKMDFADPKHCDINSIIQSANISRPSKAAILTKIACATKKITLYKLMAHYIEIRINNTAKLY